MASALTRFLAAYVCVRMQVRAQKAAARDAQYEAVLQRGNELYAARLETMREKVRQTRVRSTIDVRGPLFLALWLTCTLNGFFTSSCFCASLCPWAGAGN